MQEITWNPTRQLWETEQADLFSGQQEPFSETWPTSGMTRSGRLLPLPMSGHPIAGNECSSLLLPTPRSVHGMDCNNKIYRRYNSDGELDDRGNLECAIAEIPHVAAMLPTPRATDGTDGPVTNCPSVQAICDGSAGRAPRLSEMAAGYMLPTLMNLTHLQTIVGLLPTPRATDGAKGGPNQRGSSGDLMLPSAVMNLE